MLSILFFLQDLLWLIFTGMNRERVVEIFYIWSAAPYLTVAFVLTCLMAVVKLLVIGFYFFYVNEFGKADFRKRLLMGGS